MRSQSRDTSPGGIIGMNAHRMKRFTRATLATAASGVCASYSVATIARMRTSMSLRVLITLLKAKYGSDFHMSCSCKLVLRSLNAYIVCVVIFLRSTALRFMPCITLMNGMRAVPSSLILILVRRKSQPPVDRSSRTISPSPASSYVRLTSRSVSVTSWTICLDARFSMRVDRKQDSKAEF